MGASPIRRFRRRQKLPTLDSVRPGNKWSPVEAMGPAARSCATPGDGLERRLSPAHRRPAWERRRRQDVNSRERSDRAAAAGAAGSEWRPRKGQTTAAVTADQISGTLTEAPISAVHFDKKGRTVPMLAGFCRCGSLSFNLQSGEQRQSKTMLRKTPGNNVLESRLLYRL